MTNDSRLMEQPPTFEGGKGNEFFRPAPSSVRGRETLEFDFPGVAVGTAEYAEGPTGVTVVTVPPHTRTAIDFRGGATGMTGGYPASDAICFAGGSVYGLSAAGGVSEGMLADKGNNVAFANLSLVNGAIIYDFGARNNAVVPDAALGRAAYDNRRDGQVDIGRVGAGVSASVGKVDWSRTEYSGQGAAFRQVGDIKILVVTIVNAVGVVVDRDQTIVRGNFDPATGQRRHPAVDYERALSGGEPVDAVIGNTTITAVITNVRLTDRDLRQFGRQVHSSMHRGIQPFHTSLDGDVLFALSTDEVDIPLTSSTNTGILSLTPGAVGTIASEVAWDAVISSSI